MGLGTAGAKMFPVRQRVPKSLRTPCHLLFLSAIDALEAELAPGNDAAYAMIGAMVAKVDSPVVDDPAPIARSCRNHRP